jgi:hypothetical protein
MLQNDGLFCSQASENVPSIHAHSVKGRRQNAPILQHENAIQIPPPT